MDGAQLHALFDVLAWFAGGAALLWLTRSGRIGFPVAERLRFSYLASLIFGSAIGAYLFGTLNLWLSGQPGFGRSIEGAMAGAIVAVEAYKRSAGITTRTGARYALPLSLGIAIGRVGCFLAGLEDFTYGTPTALPWGHDFGDGIPRHPVQLYEAAAMLAFAAVYLWRLLQADRFWIERGFYLAVGFYGLQRFLWEFLKPYAPIAGPFTLFHLLSAAIAAYAVVMLATMPRHPERTAHERAFA